MAARLVLRSTVEQTVCARACACMRVCVCEALSPSRVDRAKQVPSTLRQLTVTSQRNAVISECESRAPRRYAGREAAGGLAEFHRLLDACVGSCGLAGPESSVLFIGGDAIRAENVHKSRKLAQSGCLM